MRFKVEDEKKKKKKLIIIIILLILTMIAVGISIWAFFFREPLEISPDYAPAMLEPNAELLVDDDDEELEAPEGGGAVSIAYSVDVGIDLSEKTVSLIFENPSKSTQDMVVQLVIQDIVIAQSGRIEAGYGVTTLELLDTAMLTEGIYEGEMMALYYDPITGEKAMINTEIPVTITVTE